MSSMFTLEEEIDGDCSVAPFRTGHERKQSGEFLSVGRAFIGTLENLIWVLKKCGQVPVLL